MGELKESVVEATLVKRITDDGLVEIRDEIPLGQVYQVDLETVCMMRGLHIQSRALWEREMIWDAVAGGYLPTELLEIESQTKREEKEDGRVRSNDDRTDR